MKVIILFLLVASSLAIELTQTDIEEILDVIARGEAILKSLKPPSMIEASMNAVKYYCANQSNQKFTQVNYNDPDMKRKLQITKPIVFILHGWKETSNQPWAKQLSDAWIKYHDVNVCRVDWSHYSNLFYPIVAMYHIQNAAELVAKFIKELNGIHSIPYDRITLAGFSLGGQLCGLIGNRLGSKIGKIIGIDPAGPLFTNPIVRPVNYRLDKDDAKHVIVIHATDWMYGPGISSGHQDFYPNYGIYPQDGCVWPVVKEQTGLQCAHMRAVEYLIQAVDPKNLCIGLKCDNRVQYFIGAGCTGTEQLRVDGVGKPGKYYFITEGAKCTGK